MKFLRVGSINQEKPAIVDENGLIRDISSLIQDLNNKTINNELIKTIGKTDVSKLPILSEKLRVGACISNPQKFIGIGLNFEDPITRIMNKLDITYEGVKNEYSNYLFEKEKKEEMFKSSVSDADENQQESKSWSNKPKSNTKTSTPILDNLR